MIDIVWSSKLKKLRGKELEIIDLHLNQKIPVLTISQMYGCDRKPIVNILRKNGFTPRPHISQKIEGNESEIIKLYCDDKLGIYTIADKYGASHSVIKNFLLKKKI